MAKRRKDGNRARIYSSGTCSECLSIFDEAYIKMPVDEECADPESGVLIPDFVFENPSILASIHSFDDLNRFETEA
jgi:hypothetical protein